MSDWLKIVKTKGGGKVLSSSLGPVGSDLGGRLEREVRNMAQGQAKILAFIDVEELDILIEELKKRRAGR